MLVPARRKAIVNENYALLFEIQSRGEKDTMRRFVPENGNLPLGARYTFTREQPLVISSVSLLGQYGVLVPEGIRPDRF